MEEDEEELQPKPRPKADHGIHLRLKPELEARLKDWIKRQSVPLARVDAVRVLLERGLEAEGY